MFRPSRLLHRPRPSQTCLVASGVFLMVGFWGVSVSCTPGCSIWSVSIWNDGSRNQISWVIRGVSVPSTALNAFRLHNNSRGSCPRFTVGTPQVKEVRELDTVGGQAFSRFAAFANPGSRSECISQGELVTSPRSVCQPLSFCYHSSPLVGAFCSCNTCWHLWSQDFIFIFTPFS